MTLTTPHRTGAKAMREGVAAWERESHEHGDLEEHGGLEGPAM